MTKVCNSLFNLILTRLIWRIHIDPFVDDVDDMILNIKNVRCIKRMHKFFR
jgi:hypothetical protein